MRKLKKIAQSLSVLERDSENKQTDWKKSDKNEGGTKRVINNFFLLYRPLAQISFLKNNQNLKLN